MYSFLRNCLFQLSPEASHEVALDWLGAAQRLHLLQWLYDTPRLPTRVMGIDFPNPVGLAAGLDKNGDCYKALLALGFGFVELGTVTPLPQPGSAKPRLFRLTDHNAIINRMGFNNNGLQHLLTQVKTRSPGSVIGINIGKNKITPEERALDDYLIGVNAVYDAADYITVNISSPNTPGLRNLQFGDSLKALLDGIRNRQVALAAERGRYVPVAVKIAPDLSDEELCEIAEILLAFELDAVIATNTTVDRTKVAGDPFAGQTGGLSGAPLMEKSTHAIAVLHSRLGEKVPIIGVGGILSGEDASAKIRAGASLVQIYTGFIFQGPKLIKESVEAIRALA